MSFLRQVDEALRDWWDPLGSLSLLGLLGALDTRGRMWTEQRTILCPISAPHFTVFV